MSIPTAISFRWQNLTFAREQTPLFTQLNYALRAGDALQIQGANGVGKSTFLRLCAGYIEPLAGEIFWQEQNIFNRRDEFQQHVHYLGHQHGLKLQLTVQENLQLLASITQVKVSATEMLRILTLLDCAHLRDKEIRHLSAGQCRRVAIARLLLIPRALWLLDEPITALDQHGQELFKELLTTHTNNGGIALIATHHTLTDIPILALGVTHA